MLWCNLHAIWRKIMTSCEMPFHFDSKVGKLTYRVKSFKWCQYTVLRTAILYNSTCNSHANFMGGKILRNIHFRCVIQTPFLQTVQVENILNTVSYTQCKGSPTFIWIGMLHVIRHIYGQIHVYLSGADPGFACKGGPAEILPTSRSGVAVAAKIWASKWGGGAPSPP